MDLSRRAAHVIVPLVLTAAAAAVRVSGLPAIEGFRNRVFDLYQQARPRDYAAAPVRVVEIDDESLDRLGRWPWPRSTTARFVERLAGLGAAVVAFDVVFAAPDPSSPENLAAQLPPSPERESLHRRLAGRPGHDAALAAAFGKVPVVTGFFLTSEDNGVAPEPKAGFAEIGGSPVGHLPDHPGAMVNLPGLEAAAAGTGGLSLVPEGDGIVRRVPLLYRREALLLPSLALEALRVSKGAGAVAVEIAGGGGPVQAWRRTGISRVRIVGGSSARLKDLHATPLHPAEPGANVHAQIVEQALTGRFLRRPDWADGAEVVLLALLGLFMSALLPRLGAGPCGLAGLGAVAGAFALSWHAYASWGFLLDPLFPALAALLVYLAASSMSHLKSESERRRLEILDHVKDELISTVSHDLRGPVNAMIMIVDAMSQGVYGPLTEKQARSLGLMKDSGRRLTAFVSNILDTAKMRAGRMEYHIGNAPKFTRSGGRITLAAEPDGGFVRVSVADTGVGISPEDLKRLFGKFQQLDLARQRELKATGTGLGLAICKTVVEAHGGRIWAESEPGKGTTFLFTMPCFRPAGA